MFTLQYYVGFCHTVRISHKYECPLPPAPSPTPLLHPLLLHGHRVPRWAPCVIQQLSMLTYWLLQMVLVVKNLPTNTGDVGDTDFIPGLGRCPGGGHGNPLRYSSLENPMDPGAWWATVHGLPRAGHDWAAKCTHALARARAHTHTHTRWLRLQCCCLILSPIYLCFPSLLPLNIIS